MNEPGVLFHSAEYAACFEHLGAVNLPRGAPVPVHIRTIPGTDHRDALLPYPYSWLGANDLSEMARLHPSLVTLTGVLAPGWAVSADPAVVRPYKEHYVFDPADGPLLLSRRSRRNVAVGLRHWEPADMTGTIDPGAVKELSDRMVQRRGLGGTAFDPPLEHFVRLLSVPGIRVVAACQGDEVGSVAIGAEAPGGLHLIHLFNSDRGLRTDAAAALMVSLVERQTERGGALHLGGVPAADPGIARFKQRWSTRTVPTNLVTMVVDHEAYRTLAPGGADAVASGFFPAYRQPWQPAV